MRDRASTAPGSFSEPKPQAFNTRLMALLSCWGRTLVFAEDAVRLCSDLCGRCRRELALRNHLGCPRLRVAGVFTVWHRIFAGAGKSEFRRREFIPVRGFEFSHYFAPLIWAEIWRMRSSLAWFLSPNLNELLALGSTSSVKFLIASGMVLGF